MGCCPESLQLVSELKFEVEKFNRKSNFLLWKMRVTSLLVKEGTHKALLGIETKPSKMKDDEWNDTDFRAKAAIILCLSDEVLYNVMNEETTASLWYRLGNIYRRRVCGALHEEAVIQSSDEVRYACSTTSQYFQ